MKLGAKQGDTSLGQSRLWTAWVVTLLWSATFTMAQQETMSIPMDRQIYAILKILTYDRRFVERVRPEVRIGIVYVANNEGSMRARRDLESVLEASAGKTIRGLPISHAIVPFESERTFEEQIDDSGIDVLYVPPGNSDYLGAILQISRDRQITTVTGVMEYVEQGVSIGISVVLDKPTPLINLPSSKQEGSEFDASLLRISKIFR